MSGTSEFLTEVITHAHFSFLEQMWMSWQLLSKKSYPETPETRYRAL